VSRDIHNGLSAFDAIVGRRSIRRFTQAPIADEVIHTILSAAARAASGMNMQPWMVHVVTGVTRERLSRAVLAAARRGETSLEYAYLPNTMKDPYRSRRRKIGLDLYALCGIDRDDFTARENAMLRNYDFFGAPVGFFITIDRIMAAGSWLDCGMFMQNVMIVAQAFGLETCPQQSWCDHGAIVHRELAIPDNHILLSGIAIGHADWAAPENTLVSERADPDEFAVWHR
jgi:nitroreductase